MRISYSSKLMKASYVMTSYGVDGDLFACFFFFFFFFFVYGVTCGGIPFPASLVVRVCPRSLLILSSEFVGSSDSSSSWRISYMAAIVAGLTSSVLSMIGHSPMVVPVLKAGRSLSCRMMFLTSVALFLIWNA